MEVILKIADIRVSLRSDYPIEVDAPCIDFVTDGPEYDVRFYFKGWAGVPCPSSTPVGEDHTLRYYQRGEDRCCEYARGRENSSFRTCYKSDFTDNVCYLRYPEVKKSHSASMLLQMLPISDLLGYFDTTLLHAAQVDFHGKSLLFTTPSGTGKTTQATLWNQRENAPVISGDRTAIRKFSHGWKSYGFPVDGSARIWKSTGVDLGAISVLRQSRENHVRRLTMREAFPLLMEQAVVTRFDRERQERIVDWVISLTKDIPVYLLECRPEYGAVQCWKEQLLKDGVIK